MTVFWTPLEAEAAEDTVAGIDDVELKYVKPLLTTIGDPGTLSRSSIENLLLKHEEGEFASATAFLQHLAAIITQGYDPQLRVGVTDDVEKGGSPVRTVSHDDPDVAKRAVGPRRIPPVHRISNVRCGSYQLLTEPTFW